MPLYENGLIYKLFKQDDYDNENIYIGSTTNFRVRKNTHKRNSINPNSKEYNCSKYQYIRNNDGFEKWCMTQIEPFPCNSKKELETRERYWIDTLKSKLNIYIPTRTRKEYKEKWVNDNKEIIAEKSKIYRENNVEKISEYRKNYKKDNKEEILEKSKEYYKNNKEKAKEYYENNKVKILESHKEKIVCECGCSINKTEITRHRKTIKHQKLMENIKK